MKSNENLCCGDEITILPILFWRCSPFRRTRTHFILWRVLLSEFATENLVILIHSSIEFQALISHACAIGSAFAILKREKKKYILSTISSIAFNGGRGGVEENDNKRTRVWFIGSRASIPYVISIHPHRPFYIEIFPRCVWQRCCLRLSSSLRVYSNSQSTRSVAEWTNTIHASHGMH